MKQHILLATCLLISGIVSSQEKYSVANPTTDQKASFAIRQVYSQMGAGISFAKTHGVSPYDYGKYIGNLFAPTWQNAGNFETFVRGMIGSFSLTRQPSDSPVNVTENPDASVTITINELMWRRCYGDDKWATMDEFTDFSRGAYEQIADRMGATVKIELKNGFMVFVLMKK